MPTTQQQALEQATATFVERHPTAVRLPEVRCSVCGGSDRDEYPVFRAMMVDSDGTYVPRACVGCFQALVDEAAKELAGSVDPRVAGKRKVVAVLVESMPGALIEASDSILDDFEPGDFLDMLPGGGEAA